MRFWIDFWYWGGYLINIIYFSVDWFIFILYYVLEIVVFFFYMFYLFFEILYLFDWWYLFVGFFCKLIFNILVWVFGIVGCFGCVVFYFVFLIGVVIWVFFLLMICFFLFLVIFNFCYLSIDLVGCICDRVFWCYWVFFYGGVSLKGLVYWRKCW